MSAPTSNGGETGGSPKENTTDNEAADKSTKHTKSDRKIFKKLSKIKQVLHKQSGIISSETPTLNIVVGNGGLGNNVQRSELFEIFSKYGDIADIITLPEKSFAFVCFKKLDQAIKAYYGIQGQELKCPDEISVPGIRFYLYFTNNVIRSMVTECTPPDGLILVPDFISPEEEAELLDCVKWDEESEADSLAKGVMKHRQVKHYGYEFCYDNNNVDKDQPLACGMPSACDKVIAEMLRRTYIKHRPDQLTINQYSPGQGIPPHVDTHSAFEDDIASLSLGSQVVMEFRHADGRHVPIVLPARSLLIMSRASRYQWSHGITPRKSDILPDQSEKGLDQQHLTLSKRSTRTSFTFRKVRRGKCNCEFPQQCDDQESESKKVANSILPLSAEEAVKLETNHVHKVYEEIADDFSGTRHTPWPQVVDFLKQLPVGSLVADIGCGNGKYLIVKDNHFKIGCDRSQNLCKICGERNMQVFSCDALAVPLRSNVFDAAISIAVIHHVSTKERRLQVLQEMLRILTPGGQALVYVWALEQEYKKVKSNYLKDSKTTPGEKDSVPDTRDASTKSLSPFKPTSDCTPSNQTTAAGLNVHVNRTQFKDSDVLVPFHLKKNKPKSADDANSDDKSKKTETSNVFHRFYHVFQENELEFLCTELAELQIVKSYYDKGNWCVIFKKQDCVTT